MSLGRLFSLALVRQPVKKDNSEFKLVLLCLKIDLVSHHVCSRVVTNLCITWESTVSY